MEFVPGFPDAAGGAYVPVVWWTLAGLVGLSVLVTAVCLVLGGDRRRIALVGGALLALGGVGALLLYSPAAATLDPTIESGPAECPFDTVQGARLKVEHDTRMYTFWQPCETASRVRIGSVLGGYALGAGAAGVWMLRRATRRGSR